MCICMCWYTWACMGVEGNLTYCSSEIFHLIIWDQVPGWSDTWPRGEVADQWPLGSACLCLPQWDWKCRWLWPVASSWVLGSNPSPCPGNASTLWTEIPHVPWQFMLMSATCTNFLLNALLYQIRKWRTSAGQEAYSAVLSHNFNHNYSRNFVLYFKMYVGYYETMLLKNIDKKMNPFLAFFLHS